MKEKITIIKLELKIKFKQNFILIQCFYFLNSTLKFHKIINFNLKLYN